MNIKTIIARFLPLLDVTVVLLGLMLILMAYAHFETEVSKADDNASNNQASSTSSEKALIRSIYLYAETDGTCSVITPNTETHEKKNDEDIRLILQEQPDAITWLFLLIDNRNKYEFGKWNRERINSLKTELRLTNRQKLFELRNEHFDFEP